MAADPTASRLPRPPIKGPTDPRAIAGRYLVDLTQPLPGAGGGQPAFAARDVEGVFAAMAVQVRPRHPPRAEAIGALRTQPSAAFVTPLAYGAASVGNGTRAGFVVCTAPPGPALSAQLTPWPEAELIAFLLRPVIAALQQLQARHVTHRAVRLDNMFRAEPGQPVVLGNAWAAPPASLQPALYEPPYSIMCLPCGRGEGTSGDDVYALGVAMVTLALGRLPLPGMDDQEILHAKIDRGSFAAIVGGERLPGMIADLARGMLAEDPEHRPPLALLADVATARARRVSARPLARAQRPFSFVGHAMWNARSLAVAMASHPEDALQVLRDGSAPTWLRRDVGDASLAARVEEAVKAETPDARTAGSAGTAGEATTVMQAICALDPLAPMCWRGIAVMPSGLGPALAASVEVPAVQERLEEAVTRETARLWAAARDDVSALSGMTVGTARQRALLAGGRGPMGRARLLYATNPLLPCESPHVASACVAELAELLPALEEAAPRLNAAGAFPADLHVAAFIAARSEQTMDRDLLGGGADGAVAQLSLFASLQGRLHPAPLPALAAWLGAPAVDLVAIWHSRLRRQQLQEALAAAATAGDIDGMLSIVTDREGLAQDRAEAAQAGRALAIADRELHVLEHGGAQRADLARRLGQEVAAGIGLASLVTMLLLAALG